MQIIYPKTTLKFIR